MIDLAMSLLQAEMASYLISKGDPANVVIDNIGLSETSNGTSLVDNIVVTLVNIEEESALKNQSALKRFSGGTALYESTPAYLNLYVLISCNYFGEGYILALKRLALVIQFLQGKTSFSSVSSVETGIFTPTSTSSEDLLQLRFTLELYTLTFEQINHLWGSLGGRQVPFAMYKLRLVGITERKPLRIVPVIQEIDTILTKISDNN